MVTSCVIVDAAGDGEGSASKGAAIFISSLPPKATELLKLKIR
jgi:hypothetical protein